MICARHIAPSTKTTPSINSPSGASIVPKPSDKVVVVVNAGQFISATQPVATSSRNRNRVRNRMVVSFERCPLTRWSKRRSQDGEHGLPAAQGGHTGPPRGRERTPMVHDPERDLLRGKIPDAAPEPTTAEAADTPLGSTTLSPGAQPATGHYGAGYGDPT